VQLAELGNLAAVRIGLREDVKLEVVEQPGGLRVGAVTCHQLLGEPHRQLRPRVLAGVEAAHQKEPWLRPWNRLVGDHHSEDVVTWVAACLELVVRVAGVDHVDQTGRIRRERRHRGVGLLDRAVAREARDRHVRRQVDQLTLLLVDLDPEALCQESLEDRSLHERVHIPFHAVGVLEHVNLLDETCEVLVGLVIDVDQKELLDTAGLIQLVP